MRKPVWIAFIAVLSSAAFADVTVIEGFENTADPGQWVINDTLPGLTQNATTTTVVPVYVTTNVTEGAHAGQFNANWSASPVAGASNPYSTTDGNLYWAVRYNVNAPASLSNNAIPTTSGLLQADIFNSNAYPIQVALVVDSAASSQLKMGPLTAIAAGTSASYIWDFTAVAPVPLGGGSASFIGDVQRLKSIVIYTATQPTAATSSITIDNIRNGNSPDVTAPAPPKLATLGQGGAAGQAVVRWTPSPDSDVALYNVYVATDANFGTPNVNRLTFPGVPAASVGSGNTAALLSGLPPNQNLYVTVTAVDNAPVPNESEQAQALAVRLKANGAQPDDRIVMDSDRYQPGVSQFVSQGYFHGVVYTAQALGGLNRSFDSVTDEALENSQASLTPGSTSVVVWSTLDDGSASSADPLSATSIATIGSYLQGSGNLIISGSGLAEAIAAQPGGTTTLANSFKVALQSASVGVPTVVPTGPLYLAPTLSTSLNTNTNAVAYATTANDGLLPQPGAVTLVDYQGVPESSAVAGIGLDENLVFLGFAFESAGDAAGPAASTLARQTLMQEMIYYLTAQTAAQDWQLYN